MTRAAKMRTSETLRTAASWLDGAAEHCGYKQRDREQLVELAAELRVRAIWIERARTDEGVSEERRRGIAAIEDAESR